MCERWNESAWFTCWMGGVQGYVEELHMGKRLTLAKCWRSGHFKNKWWWWWWSIQKAGNDILLSAVHERPRQLEMTLLEIVENWWDLLKEHRKSIESSQVGTDIIQRSENDVEKLKQFEWELWCLWEAEQGTGYWKYKIICYDRIRSFHELQKNNFHGVEGRMLYKNWTKWY